MPESIICGFPSGVWIHRAGTILSLLTFSKVLLIIVLWCSSPDPDSMLGELNWGFYIMLHVFRLLWVVILLRSSAKWGLGHYDLNWGVYVLIFVEVIRMQFYAWAIYAARSRRSCLLLFLVVGVLLMAILDLAVTGGVAFAMMKMGAQFLNYSLLFTWVLFTAPLNFKLVVSLISYWCTMSDGDPPLNG